MENKVSYEQIESANKEIETIKLGTKGYAQVNERIKAYRKVYPTGSLTSEIEEIKDDYVRIRATATDENGKVIATGTASEKLTGNDKKDYINSVSMVENCETSAYGRCLGFAGFGVDTSIASAEDVEKSKNRSKLFEIYANMFIKEEEAKSVIKSSINELCRKLGVRGTELDLVVQDRLWATLNELSSRQLLNVESKLKTANMKDNEWHNLYKTNEHIKDVVAENQEVIYASSWYKFGKLALEQAGTNTLLQDEIKEHFYNIGINLEE